MLKIVQLSKNNPKNRFFTASSIMFYGDPIILELKKDDTLSGTADILVGVYNSAKKLCAQGAPAVEIDTRIQISLNLKTEELKAHFVNQEAKFREYFVALIYENETNAIVGTCTFTLANNPLAFIGESSPTILPPPWTADIRAAIEEHNADEQAHDGFFAKIHDAIFGIEYVVGARRALDATNKFIETVIQKLKEVWQ